MNCKGIWLAFAFSLTLSCGNGNKGTENLQHLLSGNFTGESRKTSEVSGTNGPACPDVCAAVCSGQPEPEIPLGCPVPMCSCGTGGQQSTCAAPIEWQVSLCLNAPLVVGKKFSRKNSSDEECKRIMQSGTEASCEDWLEFRSDGMVDYVIGGGDVVERSCYHQQGGCLAMGDFKKGDWNSLPNKSFSVSEEGGIVSDNVRQVAYAVDLGQPGDCQQRRSQIDAALDEVAICSVDADCSYKGLHPHYGCFFTFNKSRNTTLVEELVNSYSTSECWDGSTTDCAMVDQEMLKCKNARCVLER